MSGLEDKLAEHAAIPLFPTLVWASQLRPEVTSRVNEALFRKLERARQGQPDLKPTGKWQTDQRLHHLPELAELCDIVVATARHVLDQETKDTAPEDVVGWVQKPPQLEQLAEVLAQALGTD